MSKVVKKVGKVVKKVVKGVVRGVKKIWKKVRSSKFLKIAAIAAGIYFGGAALMGGLGGMGAGAGGFMAGAKAGVASAWGGITGAGTALASGNIAGAGSSLASGFTGAKAAGLATGANALTPIAVTATKVAPTYAGAASAGGAGTVTAGSTPLNLGIPGTAGSTAPGAGNFMTAAQQSASQLAKVGVTPQMVANAGATTASKGLLGSIGSAWNSLGPYGKFAAVQGGIGLTSGYLQGKAEEDAAREALAQYQANMGGVIYAPVYNPATGLYEVPYQAGGVA